MWASYEPVNGEPPEKKCVCSPRAFDACLAFTITAGVLALVVTLVAVLFPREPNSGPMRGKALIIGLDGAKASVARTAMFNRGIAPNLRNLLASGVGLVCSGDGCARTHDGNRFGSSPPTTSRNYSSPYQWVTGPGWCSVVTGVSNSKHLVRGNSVVEILPFAETSKRYPTIFTLAKRAGLRTAASGDYGFLSSPSPSGCLPGIVDFECSEWEYVNCGASSSCNLDFRQALPESDDEDGKTASFTVDRIRSADADVVFAHFVGIDVVGHRHGWGSEEQLEAMKAIDLLLGEILRALESRSEPWLIIVTSDHGGLGLNHGMNWNDDEFIPFIVSTRNWAQPLRNLTQPVFHYDVAPTVAKWLKLPLNSDLDGVPQGV
jgi:hypothetical protein